MVTRTQSKDVMFARPFILDGMDRLQPAGTYTIDTEEERIDTLNLQVWRRVGTFIRLESPGRTQYLPVDPERLDKALMRDGAQPAPASPAMGASARRHRDRALGLWPSRSKH